MGLGKCPNREGEDMQCVIFIYFLLQRKVAAFQICQTCTFCIHESDFYSILYSELFKAFIVVIKT